MGGNIQNGKEGTIISAYKMIDDEKEEWYCIKIYKESTMEFKNKKQYIHVFYSLFLSSDIMTREREDSMT